MNNHIRTRSSILSSSCKRVGFGKAVFAGLGLLLAGGTAHAELIAADPFLTGDPANATSGEYDTAVLVSSSVYPTDGGQNPVVDGFVGAWDSNLSGVAQWTAAAGNVDDDSGDYTGGRARFGGVDNLQRRVHRTLDTYTASDTYYMSFLATTAVGDTDGDGFVGVGFTNNATDAELAGTSDGLFGLLVGFSASPDGSSDLVVRYRDETSPGVYGATDTVLISDVPTAGQDGSVFRVVVRLDHEGAPFNPDGEDVITAWVNPGSVATEAEASASVTPTTINTFALPNNSLLTQLTMTGIDYSKAASFDEIRLGTSFENVIPEPSSLALLFVGATLIVGRRGHS